MKLGFDRTANKGHTRYGKLHRRFLKSDTPSSTAYFAQVQERLKKRAEKYKSLQKRARANKVAMFRQYRKGKFLGEGGGGSSVFKIFSNDFKCSLLASVGELPDIQIKHKELIVPLQVLSQKDVEISRMLFTTLFVSVFKNVDESVKMVRKESLSLCNSA